MKNYQPQSMLVTGGAGFIGSNFIRTILENEPTIKIINLDKLTYAGSLDNLKHFPPERHHLIQGDINNSQLVRHILQHHHIDTIVHFAAETHVDRSIDSARDFVETNVMGTFTLLEEARHHWFDIEKCLPDHCRFHHVSTDEVYGSLSMKEPACTEDSTYKPRSPYAASKASSDHLVNAYYHTYGLPITLSHCSNNYGPHQHIEKFIPMIINTCLNQQAISIYGDGENIRDWLFVDDHCNGIMTIIKQGKVGECYNLGANNEWKNSDLARYICEQLDEIILRQGMDEQLQSYTSLLKFVKDRPGHDFRYALNADKAMLQLGWQPNVSFKDGLRKTIEFYLKKHAVE